LLVFRSNLLEVPAGAKLLEQLTRCAPFLCCLFSVAAGICKISQGIVSERPVEGHLTTLCRLHGLSLQP
jgi:hypothetical protein